MWQLSARHGKKDEARGRVNEKRSGRKVSPHRTKGERELESVYHRKQKKERKKGKRKTKKIGNKTKKEVTVSSMKENPPSPSPPSPSQGFQDKYLLGTDD